jgi:hypothetical protein
MHPDLRRALEKLARTTEPIGPVIRSYRGGNLKANSFVNWFVTLFQELGFEGCSSHSGRRRFITGTTAAGGSRVGAHTTGRTGLPSQHPLPTMHRPPGTVTVL